MSKPDRKPDPDNEPNYDIADAEHDDVAQASYDEVIDAEYDDGTDPEYDDTAQVDFELAADPEYDEGVVESVAEAVEAVVILPAEEAFAFELGRAVLPLMQVQPYTVVWRGYLKERHPATGLVCRVPVYRLADGFWDCYREEELQAA